MHDLLVGLNRCWLYFNVKVINFIFSAYSPHRSDTGIVLLHILQAQGIYFYPIQLSGYKIDDTVADSTQTDLKSACKQVQGTHN